MRGLSLRCRNRRIIGTSVGAFILSAMLLAGFTQAADASTKYGHSSNHKPRAQKCQWVRENKITTHKHRHHHRGHHHHAHRRGHWVCTPNTTAPKSTTTEAKPATPTTNKPVTTTTKATTTTTVAPTTTTTTTEPPEPETTTTTTVEPFCLGFWVNGVCIYYF